MRTPKVKEPTQAQLSACHRIIDENKNEVFYLVDSAHTADQYEVRFIRGHGLTCTCRAGREGIPCWHKRAAVAHDTEFKRLAAYAEAAQNRLLSESGARTPLKKKGVLARHYRIRVYRSGRLGVDTDCGYLREPPLAEWEEAIADVSVNFAQLFRSGRPWLVHDRRPSTAAPLNGNKEFSLMR